MIVCANCVLLKDNTVHVELLDKREGVGKVVMLMMLLGEGKDSDTLLCMLFFDWC